ncbi:MAG: DUF3987 domain-containing protein [Chitinophagales bacterium]|nr:DUF3987 domain-containing protein [Chitinophagaceae bacterium]MCB9066062.1 DUF3987 domain-containing protein [Chitinophagales bacterium]
MTQPLPQEENPEEGYRNIPTNIFMHLPKLLREPCLRFTDEAERELFLIGAIGVVSGMLPNYTGGYFGHETGTNLYCFIIGRYGTGKGALKWAQKLGEATHQYKLQSAKETEQRYKADKAEYLRKQAQYNKGELKDPPQEPATPRHLKLFIPANTTKTAVMQLLQENDGSGIIFETEGDTLADMLRQDYGNFSDILRKAYHHEALSFFRRANNEDVEVRHPALSVVLSGTYDQLLKLIPTIDNGLFSRFMYYLLDGNDEFRNPFEKNDAGHASALTHYSEELLQLYRALEERQVPLKFFLSQKQQQEFVGFFTYMKEWIRDTISDDMEGSVNRMAIMAYRIAMILTVLRHYGDYNKLNPIGITCTDEDMDAACKIVDVLAYNATDVYRYLEQNGLRRAPTNKKEVSDDERLLCYRYKQQGMSNRQIAINVFGNVNSKNKVKRILKDYGIE